MPIWIFPSIIFVKAILYDIGTIEITKPQRILVWVAQGNFWTFESFDYSYVVYESNIVLGPLILIYF